MPDVLSMPARQIGDPVVLVVLMESCDGLVHAHQVSRALGPLCRNADPPKSFESRLADRCEHQKEPATR